MKVRMFNLMLIGLIFILGSISLQTQAQIGINNNQYFALPTFKIDTIINRLPNSERWIEHLRKDLMPFWDTLTALGGDNNNGMFPSCRCNDGSIPEKGVFDCEEYKKYTHGTENAALVTSDSLYTRAHARQIFAYGVGFHMTGEVKYLDYMKAGVDYMRNNAIDRTNRGAAPILNTKTGEWGPKKDFRTSQDMAYALSGIGFYYYLTRDKAVLDDIVSIKNYIFDAYYDEEIGMLKWVLANDGENNPDQLELVAQLDQIYAYMIWLTPALPDSLQSAWKKDLKDVAGIMIDNFYSIKYGFFWGALTDNKFLPDSIQKENRIGAGDVTSLKHSVRGLGTPHTDFGHSVKTFWLIYQIGKLTKEPYLTTFAADKIARLLDVAYVPATGSWARRFDQNGLLDRNKEWWGLAILDQTTSTLSLRDPSYARYLVTTYEDWFTNLVDHKNHGIWHLVSENNEPDLSYPKQHTWKNAFHSFEHCLVAYITTGELKENSVKLYYAFDREMERKRIQPYLFMGKITGIKDEATKFNGTFQVKQMSFQHVR